MQFFRKAQNNILLIFTLFLLVFIPLYPKLPLIGITHTWVYIRLDDFLILLAVIIYAICLKQKHASFNTPLTAAIVSFLLAGLTSTILAVFFIFPHLQGVFPKIALLYWLRHVEYLSLYFISFSAIKDKKHVYYLIPVITLTLGSVVIYGLGQRFFPLYFPAYSTMNEQFAKGYTLILNATDRLQSTFAGHYDLGAYLVLITPVLISLIFAYLKRRTKAGLLLLAAGSLILLLMTSSRTSFAVFLAAATILLILIKQKRWIIPMISFCLLMLFSFSNLYYRYASTVRPVRLAYDTKGKVIGIARENSKGELEIDKTQIPGSDLPSSELPVSDGKIIATASGVIIKEKIPGTQEIKDKKIEGKVIIAETQTLDISIATRLQAEWPNAWKAFLRNPLFGSGYSSVGLATDGNYFRILAETGLLGFAAFISILVLYARYLFLNLHSVNETEARHLLLGIFAGVVGICLNALLIDVFEASKIAYSLWLLIGISIGILHVYKTSHK